VQRHAPHLDVDGRRAAARAALLHALAERLVAAASVPVVGEADGDR
jgi:hypothetical protein